MNFFTQFFRKKSNNVKVVTTSSQPLMNEIDRSYVQKGLTEAVSETEKEVVAIITASILAGTQPDTRFKVKRIFRIDEEKKLAVAMVAAIAANDAPNSHFVLKKIEMIQK